VILLILVIRFSGCVLSPAAPDNPENLCEIFRENPGWYRAAVRSQNQWKVSIPIMMAIIYHESRFNADAAAPRSTWLYILPGSRLSSAYGYPQAIDSTWTLYRRHTGNRDADRGSFTDAVDFVGWYCDLSHIQCGISKTDPVALYLAYHEGQGGYNRGSHRAKPRLIRTARAVGATARRYAAQLSRCRPTLDRRHGFPWPF